MSDIFKYCSDLTSALHDLMMQGKGDSPEADEIRDKMDKPWLQLTEEERKNLAVFSAGLYRQEEKEVNKWLLRHALDTEWETHHAAEDTYCPYCATPDDTWRTMREHHEGCEYVKMIEKAKALYDDA